MDYQQGVPIRINDTFRVAGVLTNPTTIVYTILGPDNTTTTYTWPGAPEIANPSVGVFQLSISPPAFPGLYHYDVDATGAVVSSRAATFSVLPNVATASTVTWPVKGPCNSWVSSQSIWDCCGQPVDSTGCAIDMSAFAFEASQVLFELSGRQFSGACEKTVRPCATRNWCGVQVLSRGHVIGWEDNRWSGNVCGCQPLDSILLSGYPVREITEVKIDGVVVNPNTYKLSGWRHLVRVRDPADPDVVLTWPACQALDLPDTEEGTFSVTYTYGQDPPLIGIHAAAQLGCEIYRACAGGDCALPTGTTRVSRQGVIVEREALTAWGLQEGIWRTGLQPIDAFLNAYNSPRMTRRPTVWSPASHMRYARPEMT